MKFSISLPLVLALLPGLLFQSCKKTPIYLLGGPELPQEMPAVTTEGKNTFGCYLDGELWLPRKKTFLYGGAVESSYNQDSGYLDLKLFRDVSEKPSSYMKFSAGVTNEIRDTGIYRLYLRKENTWGYRKGSATFYRDETSYYDSNFYYTDTLRPVVIHIIKLDRVKRIIAGTFEFSPYNKYLQKEVRITGGRFDFIY